MQNKTGITERERDQTDEMRELQPVQHAKLVLMSNRRRKARSSHESKNDSRQHTATAPLWPLACRHGCACLA